MRFLLEAITAWILTIVFSGCYLLTIPFVRKNRTLSFFAYHWSNIVLGVSGIRVKTIGLRKGEVAIFVDPPIDITGYRDRRGTIELMNKVREIIKRNYMKQIKA